MPEGIVVSPDGRRAWSTWQHVEPCCGWRRPTRAPVTPDGAPIARGSARDPMPAGPGRSTRLLQRRQHRAAHHAELLGGLRGCHVEGRSDGVLWRFKTARATRPQRRRDAPGRGRPAHGDAGGRHRLLADHQRGAGGRRARLPRRPDPAAAAPTRSNPTSTSGSRCPSCRRPTRRRWRGAGDLQRPSVGARCHAGSGSPTRRRGRWRRPGSDDGDVQRRPAVA